MAKKSEKIGWEVFAGAIVFLTLIMFLLPAFAEMLVVDDENIIRIRASIGEDQGFNKDSIQVKAGETITFEILSMDMTHSFVIDEFDVDSGPISSGKQKVLKVVFDEPGEYTFYCGVFCSAEHGAMRGTITVV